MGTRYSDEVSYRGDDSDGGWNLALSGPHLDRLAAALANQFAVLYEASPGDPHVALNGSMLTFTFQEGFSESEKDLLREGRQEELREFRERVLRAVAEEMNEVVEALIPSTRVGFYFAAFEASSRTTHCFFVLDWTADSGREQREAIRAWSEQVRRHARDLRGRSSHSREANLRLKRGFAELRRKSHRG